MAERRIIEGRWRCSTCDAAGLLGRHKHCPQCGNPREAGEMDFDFGERRADGSSTAETVDDAELLDLASVGPDWHCARCDSGNRGDYRFCTACGAPREPDSGAAPPDPPPSASPPPPPPRRAAGLGAGLLGGSGCVSLLTLVCCCGAVGFLSRDVQVQAEVASRAWVRAAQVERLVAAPAEGWEDELPEPAVVPGGDGPLREGRGAIDGCEPRRCWPRPPAGASTARVTSRSWSRSFVTQVLEQRRRTGFRDEAPSPGELPGEDGAGREGAIELRCDERRERTPERCRDVSREVECGTERRCTIEDQGNGFAEEVCTEVPRYCTEKERVCEPAVVDDWCRWTELRRRPGRVVEAEGDDARPRWPAFTRRADESVERRERYEVKLERLVGTAPDAVRLRSADELEAWRPGQLVFVAGGRLTAVPDALVPPGEAYDCGEAIPRDQRAVRSWCRFERWSWQDEPAQRVSSADGPPPWPALAPDQRAERREWLEVELRWEGRRDGSTTLEPPVAEWERWSPGTRLPVIVDHRGELVELVGMGE